jgi:crotonobetainyl-CoA:carnitine CoA-transferase CaiB-like acyl-CoA transferase
MNPAELPLAGVRVIDLTRQLAGPACGQILGDLGAEVIKVENPNALDEIREWPPHAEGGTSTYFLAGNRNKRSVTIDLAAEGGLDTLHTLCESADVVLENFRLDVGEKFGFDPESFRARHPRVVLGSVRGYAEGPQKGTAAYDASMQAVSGLMSLTGERDGPPARIGVAIVDQTTALYATIGVLAALQRARQTGEGSHVEVALYDCAIASLAFQLLSWTEAGVQMVRTGTAHPAMVPNKVFATAAGEILMMCGNDRQWAALTKALAIEEIRDDERFATNPARVTNQDELYAILDPIFATRPRAAWEEILREARVAYAPVNNLPEVAEYLEEHSSLPTTFTAADGRELGLISNPVRVDGEVLAVRDLPLEPGRDNEEILGSPTPHAQAMKEEG